MAHFDLQIAALLKDIQEHRLLKPWLILLEGDLGVGKTTWTQEFVGALGGNAGEVKSPTFLKLLNHDIKTFGQLLHIDAYRIEDSDEFLRLGLESYENVAAMVIEWPQVFFEFLQEYPEYKNLLGISKFVRLKFSMDSVTTQRLIDVEWGSV